MNIQHEVSGVEPRAALLAWCAGASAAADPWWPAAFRRQVERLPHCPTVGQVKAARRRANAVVARRFARLLARTPGQQRPAPKTPGVRQSQSGIVLWWPGGCAGYETALSVQVASGRGHLQYTGAGPSGVRWPAVLADLEGRRVDGSPPHP